MSHSEEGENYWPGYVDALTSMVQVLAFVMMMLAMAVFVLSQSVSKHAVETIAEAVKADVKPNADMKQLTQAVLDKLQSLSSPAAPSEAKAPTPPAEKATPAMPAPADAPSPPSPDKLVGLRLSGAQQRREQTNAPPPSDAPRLTLEFAERSFRLEPQWAQSMTQFMEDNKAVERAEVITINAYAYSGDGALTEARRLGYYRAMMARKQLVDAKVRPENIRINVNDTADKGKGSTIEMIVSGAAGSH